jgi:hypothetical protein
MTQDELMNVLGGAQALCAMDAKKQIKFDRSKMPARDGNGEMIMESASPAGGDYGWDDPMLTGAGMSSIPTKAPTPDLNTNISEAAVKRSKLPEFIKQSMINEVIDTSNMATGVAEADLAAITSRLPRKAINETVTRPQAGTTSIPPAPVAIGTSSVDYTIIKAIINECLETKFKELGLTKEKLNEATLSSIHLKGGKIKLVDNSGNVFSASLVKQGNLNENKN